MTQHRKLSKPWDDTFKDVANDPEFRKAFLAEAVNLLLEDDLQTGKSTLRRFINNTLGFEKLATLTGKPPTSLMRMLSDSGNPTAANLLSVIHVLQEQEGMHLSVVPEEDDTSLIFDPDTALREVIKKLEMNGADHNSISQALKNTQCEYENRLVGKPHTIT